MHGPYALSPRVRSPCALQDKALRRQLNKDTRINLAVAQLFTATDYLQVSPLNATGALESKP